MPSRGPTAHVIENKIWVIGGCKGPKDHLATIQTLDLSGVENDKLFKIDESLTLKKERSCHMSAYS